MARGCHIETQTPCPGMPMKVEFNPDLHRIQRLEPSVSEKVAPSRPQDAAPGFDALAGIFSQEAAAQGTALTRRAIGRPVTPVEQLAQLYDQLGHPAQKSLAKMVIVARQYLERQQSLEKLVDLTGGDPARTYVVLRQLTAQAEALLRQTQAASTRDAQVKSEAALARAALAKLEIQYKREIQAGLNIALALQSGSDDPAQCQAIRTLYYANVVVRQSLASMMQALLKEYGGEQFAVGLNLMRRALADDIAAYVSSIPTARLRTLLLGLQSCGQLGGVLSNCRDLVQRLNVEHDAVDLLQRLLGYAGNGIAPSEVQLLADDLAGDAAARQLASLNALYPVIKGLPAALWRDSRGREEALHNFLLVMDEFTRLEKGQIEPRALM